MKKYSIPLTLLLCSSLFANEPTLETPQISESTTADCGDAPHPVRLAVRHIEANGIGYNEGYTTIEGFFSPVYPHQWFGIRDEWTPFLDLRFHFFNDGKPALNTGIGLRRFTPHICWGLNAYYDYRKTSRQHYNQVGLGFEALGRIWDFRVNGYLPVGDTKSEGYSPELAGLQGHYLYLSQKHQIALGAINAEAGLHINEFGKSRTRNTYDAKPHLYIAAGPYYLNGHGKSTWGGQARIALDIYDYIRLEANTSYDDLFHIIGQGQLTVMIPLGRKKKVSPQRGESCVRARMFSERALQKVDRFEIIPVSHKREKTTAIDPVTGKPLFFWYVDNQSHSAGTLESPFPTLLEAQNASSPNEVIYVFPGDGTDTGMDAGITLKNGQRLLSTSLPHSFNTSLGRFDVPAMTTGMPHISSSSGSVVLLANNNEVSGLSIHGIGSVIGISGANLNGDVLIAHNLITSDFSLGAFFRTCPHIGSLTIADNTFVTVAGGNAVALTNNIIIDNVQITNCTATGETMPSSSVGWDTAIFMQFNQAINNINIADCPDLTGSTNGVSLFFNNQIGPVTVTNTNMTGVLNEAMSFFSNTNIASIDTQNCNFSAGRNGLDIVSNGQVGPATISNGTFSLGSQLVGVGIDFVSGTLAGPVTISGCTISDASAGSGISFDSLNSSYPVTISNCTIKGTSVSFPSKGVSFTNTPNGSPPFRLNLYNNTVIDSPPVIGYYIDNPGAAVNFILDRKNDVGSFDLFNVTILP